LKAQLKHDPSRWHCPICEMDFDKYATLDDLVEHLHQHDKSDLITAIIAYQIAFDAKDLFAKALPSKKRRAP